MLLLLPPPPRPPLLLQSFEDSLFDIKIEKATAGLIPYYSRRLLEEISKENALTIAKYILAMKTEIDLLDHYRQDVIYLLSILSIFDSNSNNKKSLKKLQDKTSYLFLIVYDSNYRTNNDHTMVKYTRATLILNL